MASGKVRADKTRTSLTIEREFKKQLEELAKEQNRSFNNLVITVLQDYYKSIKDNKES